MPGWAVTGRASREVAGGHGTRAIPTGPRRGPTARRSQVFDATKDAGEAYRALLQRYGGAPPNERMRRLLTDLAFALTRRAWEALPAPAGGRGRCTFCVGGVNAVIPFSATAVKNEAQVGARPSFSAHISIEISDRHFKHFRHF